MFIIGRKERNNKNRRCCGVCLLDILLPQFMLAHYRKANDVNDADKRTLKKAIETKKIIYQRVRKKETLQNIMNILIWFVKYSSLCVRVCM